MAIDPVPPLGVLALCALAAIAAFIALCRLFSGALDNEVNKVISAADVKSPLVLAVPELVSVAKQLRRATLRALRQSGAPGQTDIPQPQVDILTEQGAELTNPLFQSASILDEEEEVLELDLPRKREAAEDGFPDHIFRAYDIRGHAQAELSDDMVSRIGKAIGSLAGELDEQTGVLLWKHKAYVINGVLSEDIVLHR